MSDAFGFSSAEEFEPVDDSGDLTPYDFRELERRTRYNALPVDIKGSLAALRAALHGDVETLLDDWWSGPPEDEDLIPGVVDAAMWQLLDYFGAL